MSNKTNFKDLKIEVSKKGLKINREFLPPEFVNLYFNGLIHFFKLCTAKATDEERAQIFALISRVANNALAAMAPDLFFPTQEEMDSEVERTAKLAECFPDVKEDIEKIKEDLKSRANTEVLTEAAVDVGTGHAVALSEVKATKEELDEGSEC